MKNTHLHCKQAKIGSILLELQRRLESSFDMKRERKAQLGKCIIDKECTAGT